MNPDEERAIVDQPDGASIGLIQALPEDCVLSKEMKIFSGVEIARHQFFNEEEYNFLPLKGHVVNLHLSSPVKTVTKLDDEAWEGYQPRHGVEVFPAGKRIEQVLDGTTEPSTDANVFLDEEFVRRVAEEAGVANPDRLEILNCFTARDPQVERIMLSFLPELESGGLLGGELYVESLANALSLHLLREYSSLGLRDRRRTASELKGGLSKKTLKAATDYINDHLSDSMTVVDIAGSSNLSTHHFSRMFKETTGQSPHRYVIDRRVERAVELLTSTDLSIGEVSRACGFSSQSHLNYHFRRLLGATPGALR